MSDYGYEDAEPDYGYGDVSAYGYGDGSPDESDYGYGDTKPDEDYGYGDAKPDMDYGYGDAKPDDDNRYSDAKPDKDYGHGTPPSPAAPAAPSENRRPKRRCSVTKYSLEESKGSQEQEMVQQLNAAQMLENFRNGIGFELPQQPPKPEQRSPPAPTDSGYCTDGKSCGTVITAVSNDDEDPAAEKQEAAPKPNRRKGAMARLRRRLSLFK